MTDYTKLKVDIIDYVEGIIQKEITYEQFKQLQEIMKKYGFEKLEPISAWWRD